MIPERRCTECGSPEIAAVAPGSVAERIEWLHTTLTSSAPLTAWCMACWVRRFAHECRA